MQVKIAGGYLSQFALFMKCHGLFGTTIDSPPARFYLYEDKILFIFGDKVNLAIATTKVALQDTISPPCQCICSQSFACAPQRLADSFYFLL